MNELLAARGIAEAKDSKTVRVFTFDVPPGTEALSLRFDYAPRTTEDRGHNTQLVERALAHHNSSCTAVAHAKPEHERLDAQRREVENLYHTIHNLMNVVLIDPNGSWRGRWDRNPSSDDGALVLARDRASKGFIPGEISAGRWSVAIECHGVFGDAVTYEVGVAARGAPGERERSMLAPPSPAPAERREKRRGPGWYFGEMHSHTLHSDGRSEVFELAQKAAELGIDFVALTDHNTMSGLLETIDRDLPVTIIPGCELTTFHGHHPVYGVRELVPWHEDGRVLDLAEMAPRVRAQGGIVSVAHPFKLGDPICTGCRMPDGLDPAGFDLFEVWYRRWDAAESDNEAAYALWNDYWRRGRRVTAVAARDWHGPSQEKPFPGVFPFTGVYAEDSSVAAILDGLRRGNVIMSGGPILDLAIGAVGRGSRARIGETLPAAAAQGSLLEVRIDRLEGEAQLSIYRSGARIASLAVRAGAFDLEGLTEEPGWYRAELWRAGAPLAITNHAVIEPR